MFKLVSLVISLLAVSIIFAVSLLKTPENNPPQKIIKSEEKVQNATTTESQTAAKPIVKAVPLPNIELPKIPIPPPSLSPKSNFDTPEVRPQPAVATTSLPKIEIPEPPRMPPLDEEILMRAVVKIQCPTTDGLGKYIGSGFVVGERTVITAAHVIKDAGSENCDIIFPRERKPVHYLKGMIVNLKETIRRHDEEGIDVGILVLPEISSYPEAKAIFPKYPSISYPICKDSQQIGDKLLHFGYPSNFVDQTYLSKTEGRAVVNADIKGIEDRLSLDETFTYKSPIFDFTNDGAKMHPYMVSRVPSFYGDSGGLAFNADKQCTIGPHRGGTIGKAAGENFSVFMNLGWAPLEVLMQKNLK